MTNCQWCVNLVWDDESGQQVCGVPLDEDEMADRLWGQTKDCPFFQMGDEYKIVHKQN